MQMQGHEQGPCLPHQRRVTRALLRPLDDRNRHVRRLASALRNEWAAKLDEQGLIWAPVAKLTEVIEDPQVREMGWISSLEHPELGRFETLGTPFHVYGAEIGPSGAAPGAGADTFSVLTELGLSDEDIAQLAMDGVIG